MVRTAVWIFVSMITKKNKGKQEKNTQKEWYRCIKIYNVGIWMRTSYAVCVYVFGCVYVYIRRLTGAHLLLLPTRLIIIFLFQRIWRLIFLLPQLRHLLHLRLVQRHFRLDADGVLLCCQHPSADGTTGTTDSKLLERYTICTLCCTTSSLLTKATHTNTRHDI